MKALIVGATGATGKEVLQLLLNDATYTQVEIFVRHEIEIQHEKLKVHIIDFDAPKSWRALVTGDVLFSCLGTTLEAAGSKEAQWNIDYGYQYEFAKSAHENQVANYVLISSSNASADSFFFYSKMKGKLEDAVKVLPFEKLIIMRPPILEREASERTMEILGVKVLRFLNRFGILQSQKPMNTERLAQAMIASVECLAIGQHVVEGQAILKVG
jgi:uncharacterized protein YbjT (DUF2867 family)